MLTALYSVGSVAGADLWMKVVLLTSLAYFLICFSFRRSRSGRGVLTVLMGWLLTELLCDMVWLAWFWPGGAYRNGGFGLCCSAWPAASCCGSAGLGGDQFPITLWTDFGR